MAKLPKPKPVFVVDTREPKNGGAYSFEGFETVRIGLPTGDYSIVGLESRVAVERKEKSDGWSSISGDRERFQRCFERLAELDRALVVIECSLEEFCRRPGFVEKTTAGSAVGTYLSWMCQYRVPVVWAGSKEYAERVTLRFLYSYWKHRAGSNNGTLRISKPACLVCGCICGRCVHLNGREDHTKVCIEQFVLGNPEKNFIDRIRLG